MECTEHGEMSLKNMFNLMDIPKYKSTTSISNTFVILSLNCLYMTGLKVLPGLCYEAEACSHSLDYNMASKSKEIVCDEADFNCYCLAQIMLDRKKY